MVYLDYFVAGLHIQGHTPKWHRDTKPCLRLSLTTLTLEAITVKLQFP